MTIYMPFGIGFGQDLIGFLPYKCPKEAVSVDFRVWELVVGTHLGT